MSMYAMIWKFAVKSGLEQEFEDAYGPDGAWVGLFRRGHGYLSTELLRDAASPGSYITIDRWNSKSSYEAFRARFAGAYSAIDRRCEDLTASETEIGSYETIAPESSERDAQTDDEL